MGPNEILHRYVLPREHGRVLVEAHDGIVGGCYGGCETTRKIPGARLWWPTMHGDAKHYARSCNVCQRTGKLSHKDEMPLVP